MIKGYSIGNYPEDMDDECIAICDYFNRAGLKTVMSCESHNETNLSMFWVEFDSDVVGHAEILDFMRKHLNSCGAFCSSGRFAQRTYIYHDAGGEHVYLGWHYMAATIAAAYSDLSGWQKDDLRRMEKIVEAHDEC